MKVDTRQEHPGQQRCRTDDSFRLFIREICRKAKAYNTRFVFLGSTTPLSVWVLTHKTRLETAFLSYLPSRTLP